jgi:M6 family metalloprotease-like protein
MSAIRVLPALLLILAGTFAQLNPGIINDIINRDIYDQTNNELIPLQSNEEWLVLKISFPNDNFDDDKLFDMLEGENSAKSYINSLNSSSNLNITIINSTWKSSLEDSYWGADSKSGRDDVSGNGVQNLVTESTKSLLMDLDLSKWDYNGDGIVDRLLIIHSGNAQESTGESSAIWSHFSGLDDPIIVSDWSIEHYTIVSLSSGLGTVMHEMLHQMGAVDLYDVHSDTPSSNWNGLGIWDIMAGGNWNGNGNLPSLPSSTTLELIGANREIKLNPYSNQSITINPISYDGKSLAIEIAPKEIIRITLRSGGFDSSLPGSGILVEHQDMNNGNLEYNLVNIDPEIAWVKIIEADGNDALLRGRNTGEVGDLFSLGDSFGNEGLRIRDNHGRLVPWTATVSDINTLKNGEITNATIIFQNYNDNEIEILPPRNPMELLPSSASFISIKSLKPCDLEVELIYNSNIINEIYKIKIGTSEIPIIDSFVSQFKGNVRGTVGCTGSVPVDINIDWIKIGHEIVKSEIIAIVPWNKDSSLAIYPDYIGNDSRSYSITLSGAISRIATPITQGELNPGDPILLDIVPDGLLQRGMIAKGEIIFVDGNSLEQRLPITLQAQSPFVGEGLLPWLAQPSNGIFLVAILLSLSILTSRTKNS